MNWRILTLLLMGSLALAGNELTLETERVVVFKDGFSLVIKRARGEANEAGELYTDEVPDAAVLGSFWAIPDQHRVVSMSAGIVTATEERKETVDCIEWGEVLKANLGRVCAVELDDRTTVAGEILRVLGTRSDEPRTPPLRTSLALLPSSYSVERFSGAYFILRNKETDLMLPINRVRKLSLSEMTIERERTVMERRETKRLTIRLEGGAGPREFRLIYFRPGIRWIPTYRIGLVPEKEPNKVAKLALQAVILNEAEDFEEVPFDLVVGVPNFRFRDVVSPMVLEKTLIRALRQAAPQVMGQVSQMSNVHFQNRASEQRDEVGRVPDLPNDLAADASQDLFVYSLPKLTIPKGHRAAVPVFEAEAAYRDLYTFDLRISRHDIEASPSGQGVPSPLVLSKNRVWHVIELDNATKFPWTTGPALLMEGSLPLAQELMTYTSSGGSVRIPVTVAVDVQGRFTEAEIGREMRAMEWSGYHYARIDKRNDLSVTNSKNRAIDLEITCHIGGRATKANPEATISIGPFEQEDWQRYRGDPAANNHSVVRWKLRLDPGATVRPNLESHYFARH